MHPVRRTKFMKTLLTCAVFCLGMASSSFSAIADYVATYKGTSTYLHLGKVYPSTITLTVAADGKATMSQTFTWSLGPITSTYTGFVNGDGDIVLQSPSGHQSVGGKINGKIKGAVVTGLYMTYKADPRTYRLTRQ